VVDAADHNDLHIADAAAYWAGIEKFVSGVRAGDSK